MNSKTFLAADSELYGGPSPFDTSGGSGQAQGNDKLFGDFDRTYTAMQGDDYLMGGGEAESRLYSAWVLSQSCNAASMRVCQPDPVARKDSTTLGESRIVMRSLVGASCVPRVRRASLVCSVFGNAEKEDALRASATVHSGLSASINSGLGLCFIDCYLPFICLPKTNHANAALCFNKHQSMQSFIQLAQSTNPHLAIIPPLIWRKQCRFKFKIYRPLKRQATQLDVVGIFNRIKGDFHESYCMHKIIESQKLLAYRAANDARYEAKRKVP